MRSADRRPVAALAVAGVAAVLGLTGCATTHPQCDAGGQLRRQGHLEQAAEAYATAARQGEGSCAGEGARLVADLQARTLQAVARGRVAETARDVTAAKAAYTSALTTDRDNGVAAAGLARLSGRAPAAAADAAPVAPAGTAAGPALWLAVVAIVLLAALAAAFAALLAVTRRRLARAEVVLQSVRAEVEAARGRWAAAQAGAERVGSDVERLRSHVAAAGAQIAGERARSDRVLDVLGALPPSDAVTTHVFVAPGAPGVAAVPERSAAP